MASCTYRLPGPTTTSTRPTVSVPYASAAIACAPPIRYTRSTPHNRHAPRIVRSISPSAPGGEHTTTSSTPAARAVTTPITTVLGYGARPPGTYTAAAATGTSRRVTLWPCGSCTVLLSSTPAWATVATFAIATCKPATSSSGSSLIAASSSSWRDDQWPWLVPGGVEATRKLAHGRVALHAHPVDDLLHRLLHRSPVRDQRAHVCSRRSRAAEARDVRDGQSLDPHLSRAVRRSR